MVNRNGPSQVIVRSYQVGFGDCFLLTFVYRAGRKRHVLIDFGSTYPPKGKTTAWMKEVAQDIKEESAGRLHAVVATHRHKDHISGFATAANGEGAGDIIASCKPEVVIQPWTEDPDLGPKATGPRVNRPGRGLVDHQASLDGMQALVELAVVAGKKALEQEIGDNRFGFGEAYRERVRADLAQLGFLGETNLPNRSAVENLMRMGKASRYVSAGADAGLANILPGVSVSVLGPPTPEQYPDVMKQRQSDADEFWQLQARAAAALLGDAREGILFGGMSDTPSPEARWLVDRMQRMQTDQLLRLVRTVDRVLNNTSVILLFEVGEHALLFPGDAQIESWEYVLEQPGMRQRLQKVSLYKVGHHASRNGTPRTLWNGFTNAGAAGSSRRLVTMLSTMAGCHGDEANATEVPRKTLMQALGNGSDLFDTQRLDSSALKHEVVLTV